MSDAGLLLLSIIVIFTIVVLVRNHYRKAGEHEQAAVKPSVRGSVGCVLIPHALTVGERLSYIISNILWIDTFKTTDTLSAIGAGPLDVSDIITDCEDEFGINIEEPTRSSISGQTTISELEALLRESGAMDLEAGSH